jgi:hypothetical protein
MSDKNEALLCWHRHEVVGSAPKTNVIVVAVRYRLSLHQRGRPVQTTRALIKVDMYADNQESYARQKRICQQVMGTLDVYGPY